eukprot:c33668_g1_i1 orf=85-264(-)
MYWVNRINLDHKFIHSTKRTQKHYLLHLPTTYATWQDKAMQTLFVEGTNNPSHNLNKAE